MDSWLWTVRKTKFAPDFAEPLPFAFIVAEDVNGVILPQPAVDLLEKFPAQRLGNLRFGRALGERAERVERGKQRSAELRFGVLEFRLQPVRLGS